MPTMSWFSLFLLQVSFFGFLKGSSEVQWFAPFFSGGGYCSEAISFVQSLERESNVEVSIVQHGDSYNREYVNGLPTSTKKMLQSLSSRRVSKNSVAVCHSEPGAWYPPRWPTARCPPPGVSFSVGRTMFETDRLPEGWELRLNAMDQIWVPTHFALDIFKQAGVQSSKLRVLGEPVDTQFFNPASVSQPLHIPGVGKDTVVFLSIFKWEERKGWDILLDAYFSEFNKEEDNSMLVILTNAYHSEDDDFQKIVKSKFQTDLSSMPKIYFQEKVSQSELPSLFAAANAFVLPSRGEGWGRPHVESMSMALPIIATNWSGPTEYMTQDNSYLLSIEGLTPVKEGAFKGHLWANPSVSHLRQLMREVYLNPQEAKKKGLKARQDMEEKYSIDVMGKELKRLLDELTRVEPEHEL